MEPVNANSQHQLCTKCIEISFLKNNYFLHLIYPDLFAKNLSDNRQKPFYGVYRANPVQ